MRDIALFVKDMLAAILAIEQFVEGMTVEELRQDDKTSSAVIRKFEIVGEAAKHVPQNLRETYSRVPWKEMAGMRDRLIHAYFGIDYTLVWEAITTELPKIQPVLEQMLYEMNNTPHSGEDVQ